MMTEYIPVEKIINLDNTNNGVSVEEHISVTETSCENNEMVKVQCCRCRSDWFVKDGLGITCSGITYMLILFAEFVVIGVILLPGFPLSVWSYFHALIFSGLAFLAASSHLRAMTTNPGTIPRGNFTDENVRGLGLKAGDVVVRCTRCECIKTDRAHHCSTCQRCIRKMDHHCPWINNCVGEFNQKFFVLFTFYIMLISAYAMALAVHYIFKCSDKDWKEGFIATFSKFESRRKLNILDESCAYFSPATTIIFIVFLIFEGLLFGLFTLIMFCTQMSSVINDETGIEQLKKQTVDKDGTWKDRMKDTFGGSFGVSWFSPFASNTNARKRNEYSYFDV